MLYPDTPVSSRARPCDRTPVIVLRCGRISGRKGICDSDLNLQIKRRLRRMPVDLIDPEGLGHAVELSQKLMLFESGSVNYAVDYPET